MRLFTTACATAICGALMLGYWLAISGFTLA